MPRILARLSEDDSRWLDQRAAEQGKSRPQVLSMILRWHFQRIENKPCES
jgi:uncharacterized protein (DUF1778 family)